MSQTTYNNLDSNLETVKPLSISITNTLIETFVILFSTWTVLAQVAILFNLSFRTISIIFSIIMSLIFLCFVSLKIKHKMSESIIPDYFATGLILTLAILGSSLALFSIRPDADDVSYASRAVFYLEYPSVSLHDFKFYSPLLITQIIELFWTYVSLLFNWKFLDTYHYVVPVIGGMLIPLVWFSVFTKFTKRTLAAGLASAIIIVFLCIDGGTHRSFGNFAFVRIWQGKVLLIAILMPLFIAFSMDFFKTASFHNWAKLFLLATMSTGFSSSALFLIPSLALSLGIGYLVSYVRNFSECKLLAVYLTTLVYPIIIGISCFSFAQRSIGNNFAESDPLASSYPTTSISIYDMVFGGQFTFTSIVFYGSLILSLLVLEGRLRRFLIGWLACVFVLFLNPITSQIMINYLTSTYVYWRLIYILPFPLMIGIPIIRLFQRRSFSRLPEVVFLTGLLILTIAINSFQNRLGVFNKIEFGALHYKINKQDELDVTKMISKLTNGAMLAPIRYSSIIPMFTSRLPQIMERDDFGAQTEEEKQKLKAVNFISGIDKEGFIPFVNLLKKDLKNVVLDSSMADSIYTRKALTENKFILVDENDSYSAYIRTDSSSFNNNR